MFNFWADFFRLTYNINLSIEEYEKLTSLILKKELIDARHMLQNDIAGVTVENYIEVDTNIYGHVVRRYMVKNNIQTFKTTRQMISTLDASDIVDTMFRNAHVL